jgi:hypothetical protein
MMINLIKPTLAAITIALFGACAAQPPQETAGGLILQPDTEFQQVYLLPDADLSSYEAIGLADCEVSFRKNWLRDQNDSRIDLSSRVTQEDVNRIKTHLAAECDKFLRAALLEEPAYPLVDEFDNGEAVMIVKPSIRNLDISAPDTKSASRSRSYTTEAGEMTLMLELKDGTTGQLFGQITDKRKDVDSGRIQWTNSVTNKSAADRILKRWAAMLREGLDRASNR